MYLNTYYMKHPNESAILLSPTILVGSSSSVCITFWYSMAGDQTTLIGNLSLFIVDNYAPDLLSLVWSRSGRQAFGWLQAAVPVSITGMSYRIVFKAQRVLSYIGDIAIDDIEVFDGVCETSTASGGWSVWSVWDDCSQCASQNGILFRYRYCNNPAPSPGGRFCNGLNYEYKPCSNFSKCSMCKFS
jgi:hypothetical protein